VYGQLGRFDQISLENNSTKFHAFTIICTIILLCAPRDRSPASHRKESFYENVFSLFKATEKEKLKTQFALREV